MSVDAQLNNGGYGNTLTLHESAELCSLSSTDLQAWIDKGMLHLVRDSNSNHQVVKLFDLLSAFRSQNLEFPPRLQQYSRRILIAEDEPAMARIISRILKREGFTVAIAPDGFQALSMMEAFCPALLVLDINMPQIRGTEVIECMCSNEKYAHIQTLVVSACSEDELDLARSAGAGRIIRKPFTIDELLNSVTELLNLNINRNSGASLESN